MNIVKKLNDIHLDIKADIDSSGVSPLANELQELAAPAIIGGIQSSDWEKYMSRITDDPKELARLTGKDSFINASYGKSALAYMVANATCTIATTTETGRFVKPSILTKLDEDEQP